MSSRGEVLSFFLDILESLCLDILDSIFLDWICVMLDGLSIGPVSKSQSRWPSADA
jgi:hypothetical protein